MSDLRQYDDDVVIEYLNDCFYSHTKYTSKKEVYEMLMEEFDVYELSFRQWKYKQETSEGLRKAIEQVVVNVEPKLTGLLVEDQVNEIDPDKVYIEMIDHYEKVNDRYNKLNSNTITLDTNQPIGIVFVADQHIGGVQHTTATNIKKAFNEVELINSMINTYAIHNGDLSNNFIGSWTTGINHNRKFSIAEEAALSRKYMELLKPKLIAFVSGNHNMWTEKYAGLDTNLEMLAAISSNCFYDPDELVLSINTPYCEHLGIVVRHKWNGYSQYNPTHGIEKNAKMNHPYNASIWAGAHIHTSGLIREFNNKGTTNLAFLCGTYKEIDHYQREQNFPQANKTTAVGFVLHPIHGVIPFSNLYVMKEYMENYE